MSDNNKSQSGEQDQQQDQQQEQNGKSGSGGSQQQQQPESGPPPTILEWGARLLSVGLLVLLVGYMLYLAFQPVEPIDFGFDPRLDEVGRQSDSFVVPVHVTNLGNVSVQDLQVTAELVDASGETVLSEDVSFPLLGHGETTRVEIWFDQDPRDFVMRFNVGSYKLP